jgi:hypothetical protein
MVRPRVGTVPVLYTVHGSGCILGKSRSPSSIIKWCVTCGMVIPVGGVGMADIDWCFAETDDRSRST